MLPKKSLLNYIRKSSSKFMSNKRTKQIIKCQITLENQTNYKQILSWNYIGEPNKLSWNCIADRNKSS
jgi:hypothetical protein